MTCIETEKRTIGLIFTQIDYVNKQQSSDRGEHDLSLDRWKGWMVPPLTPWERCSLPVRYKPRIESKFRGDLSNSISKCIELIFIQIQYIKDTEWYNRKPPVEIVFSPCQGVGIAKLFQTFGTLGGKPSFYNRRFTKDKTLNFSLENPNHYHRQVI